MCFCLVHFISALIEDAPITMDLDACTWNTFDYMNSWNSLKWNPNCFALKNDSEGFLNLHSFNNINIPIHQSCVAMHSEIQ